MDQERAIKDLAAGLTAILGPEAIRKQEPLAPHTVWRIGGPADLLVVARSVEALRQAVGLAWEHQVPCRVLGGGSNVLVGDAGVRGLVVLNRARAIDIKGTCVKTESGAMLATVARQCVSRGLAGLEWAAGIPGTLGGAVSGNAGAWGSDIASKLVRASVLEHGGVVSVWPAERFEFGYRASKLKREAAAGQQMVVVLAIELGLQVGERAALEAHMADLAARRKASQPRGASCGSVFKNPPGDYAGRLIDAAGLKGRQVGGAQISPHHANFIVNVGQARAHDVQALIELAQETVQARFGVELELEIETLGE